MKQPRLDHLFCVISTFFYEKTKKNAEKFGSFKKT